MVGEVQRGRRERRESLVCWEGERAGRFGVAGGKGALVDVCVRGERERC